jgi:NAD-dependent SIR2 family protein deacetylase
MVELNPFSLWECRQCDDTICRYSVNADLKVLYPDICPLCNRVTNPHTIWKRSDNEQNEILNKVIRICNNGLDALDELQIDGYSSETITAKRDVIEYLIEKIKELRGDKNDR